MLTWWLVVIFPFCHLLGVLTKRQDNIVADMEVDMVADKVTNMEVDMSPHKASR